MDYKTDAEIATKGRARYEAQIAQYVRAVEAATKAVVRGLLLQV